MARDTEPLVTPEKIGENPFLANLKVGVHKTPMYGTYEKRDGIIQTAEIDLETDKYCRVYLDKDKRTKTVNLSARAKDLLLWLMYASKPGCQWVWIHKALYMKEAKITAHNTYKDAINELVRTRYVLSSPMQHVYWVNPDLFFNGSRVKAFPDNVVYK